MPAKKEETALVPASEENRSLAAAPDNPYADIDFADDGVNEERIVLKWPDIKLIQGTTRGIPGSERHIGDFYHTDTNEYVETLDVIPLIARDQRALFEEGDSESPVCISLDGIRPEPNQLAWTKPLLRLRGLGEVSVGLEPQPAYCKDCPFSQFAEDGTPPPCGETILMMVMREDRSFARLRIGRTGLGPVRNRISRLINGSKRLPIFTAMWSFSSHSAEKGNRKWAQLDVTTRPLQVDEIREVNEVVRAMRAEMEGVAREAAYEGTPAANEDNIIDVEYE